MTQHDEKILQCLETIACELIQSNHLKHKIMTALETLTQSVDAAAQAATALTTAVDTAVTEITTPAASDAQLLTLAASVNGLAAAIGAQAQRLVVATTPPTPTP